MQVLFDILSLIGDTILAIVNLIVTFVQDIIFIVQLALEAIAKIPSYFDWLPPPILAMITMGFVVTFIYKIAGR